MRIRNFQGLKSLNKLLLLTCFLFCSFAALAQDVTGTVTDNEGKPVPSVTVQVKGTTRFVLTNDDGKFTIAVAGNGVLVFTHASFNTREEPVNGRSSVNVSLTPSTGDLEGVVVTALGIRRESKKLGYSATAVNADQLSKERTINIGESLEGRVAGLNITPPAAGAGASNQIRLRGQVGFAGVDNAPLLVVNGLPLDQDARSVNPGTGGGVTRDRGDNLANINPDDIESITVLKGATAAALYGSRAARGAIIITTKTGQRNQGIGVDITSNYTAAKAINFLKEITQTEYGQGLNGQVFTTAGQVQGNGQFGWGAKLDGQPVVNFDGEMRPYKAYPNQLFEFLRTGTTFTNTVGVSGGNAQGSFRASMSTTAADGIVPNNEYKRNIFNLGVNYNVTKNLKFTLNANYADEDYINPPTIGQQGDGAVNFFTRMPVSVPLEAYRDHATDPATGAEWRTNGFQGTINNPYYPIQHGQKYKEDRNRLLGTATLRWDVTKWLYAQGRFNYDRYNNYIESWDLNGQGSNTVYVDPPPNPTYRGSYNLSTNQNTNINADFLIGTNHQVGKFSIEASFGGNTLATQNKSINLSSSRFSVPNFYSYGNGQQKNDSYGFSETRLNSLYGMAEFGFNELLFIGVTGRNDWFSILHPDRNSKFYPSVTGSFIFSELLDKWGWLSFGKLRGSWAHVGSASGVGPYEGQLTYGLSQNLFNGQQTASINTGNAPNIFLQPFTVKEVEVGLELRMFQNRLLIDIAAFDKVTTDQIVSVTLSSTSGYNASRQNEASLKNQGLETLIEYKPIVTKNFTWTTSWNNAYLKTKVLNVGDPSGIRPLIYYNNTGNEFLGALMYAEGLAMNQLYTRTYKRNDKGEILVRDNGLFIPTDGTTPGAENTSGFLPIGSAIPKFTGGWSNTFHYKNLSLNVHIDYKFGGVLISSTLLNMTRQGLSKMSLQGREDGIIFPGVYASSGLPNTTKITVNSTPVNLQQFWTEYRTQQIGDPFVFKSDFVKLRNISLSYSLNDVIKKVDALKFIKGLSLTAACRNVAVLHKDVPGLDPESVQSSGDTRPGYENSALPTTRNYSISLNVKF